MKFDMSDLSKKHSGKLRVGASITVAQYVIPPILASFRQKFKDVVVTLTSGNTEQVKKPLLNIKIDGRII